MFYKIAFIDLDGTLLDIGKGKNAQISDTNLHSVRKLAKECKIVISTGRKFSTDIVNIGKKISANFYVCQNGAEIYDQNLNLIFKTSINQKVVEQILSFAKKWNISISFDSKIVFSPPKSFLYLFSKLFSNLQVKNINKIDLPKSVKKILLFSPNIFKISKFRKFLEEFFSEKIQIYTIEKGFVIEITDFNASKGQAAAFISKVANISLNYSFHIGDSENDISTKNIVQTLILMKNSPRKLKKHAHIIGYKRKFGVAKALENFIFNPKSIAIVGFYASGKTTFLKAVEKFGYSVLYTDEFYFNCFSENNPCFEIVKKFKPDFIHNNVLDKNKLRDFMVESQQNRDFIEQKIYPILEEHLRNNYYHFVEIPNLWTKNADFQAFFWKTVWISASRKQLLLNIKAKKVKKEVWQKNQALNGNKIKFYNVKISNSKWKRPSFFPKFFTKIFK
ncbi:HAD-IIB family hydrolase [Mesomycoplasma ovipneumoniae]|uniref:HAD-IIB family hydrolase n=1 Tax=Mesomycoplasma ovipneumoniae TaxID=29562 RepID=UPI00311B2084